MARNERRIGWVTTLQNAVCRLRQMARKRVVLHAARQGDFAPLLHDAETALSETLWRCGADHANTGRKLAAVATVHAMRGETVVAVPLLRRAVSVLAASRDAHDPAEVTALQEQLAELLRVAGDYRAAETLYTNLLAGYEAAHGIPRADTARALDNLALTRKGLGRIADAKAGHRDALLLWETTRGAGSPEVARCLTHLATLYLSERRYDEAEPLLLRAVAAWESSPNPNDLYALITLSCCGDLYRSTGRGAQARGAEAAAKAVLAHYAK